MLFTLKFSKSNPELKLSFLGGWGAHLTFKIQPEIF